MRVQMGDTGGVRNSWGSRLPSYRQHETDDGMSRYEAPVFVPQTPSAADRRRHSLSGMQLTDALKQRTLQPVATFNKVSKSSRSYVSFQTLRPWHHYSLIAWFPGECMR